MKLVGQLLLILFFIALLALVIYFLGQKLLSAWAPIMYFTYMFIGFCACIAGFINIMIKNRGTTFIEKYMLTVGKVLNVQSMSWTQLLILRARAILSTIAKIFVMMILWPIPISLAFHARSKRPDVTDAKLPLLVAILPIDPFMSLCTTILIVASYGFAFLGVSGSGYVRIWLWTLGVSVVCRETEYSIGADGLPARLRKISAGPYLNFVLITILDFISLILFISPLINGTPLTSISLESAKQTAIGLLKFRDLGDFIFGENLTGIQIVVAIVGLIFYTALLSSIIRFREFARGDVDLTWLANHSLKLGDYANALRYIRSVRERTNATDAVHIAALLGVNDVEKAFEVARINLRRNGEEDDIKAQCYRVSDIALMFGTVPGHVTFAVCQKWAEAKMPDTLLGPIPAMALEIP